MDELASAAGKDPYEYRPSAARKITEGSRHPRSHCESRRLGPAAACGRVPRHRATEAYGSYTSAWPSSRSTRTAGEHPALGARIDPGYAVNPDNIQAQMQGSSVFMLTAMFWGEITIKEGRVEQSNFHDYRMMRLREMPKIEVVLAPSADSGRRGRARQASIAPAVCNAIFAAIGKRVRSLPLKNHGLTLA